MENLLDACLAFELTPSGDGPAVPPSEFRIFSAGVINTTKGKFIFDEEAALSVMADLAEYGNELAIDYNHGMAEERPVDPALSARAAGWFTPELRAGELWATNVRWTPAAAAAIANREWRYQSPWFLHDSGRRVLALLNTALTNTPATKNLTPLVASRLSSRTRKEQSTMSNKVALALGLAESTEESTVITTVTAHREVASSLLSLTGKSTTSEALGVVQGWKTAAEQVPGLQSELATLRKASAKSEVEGILTKHAKKVSPAMRAEWEKLGLLDDPKRLDAMLSVMPDLMPEAAKPPASVVDTASLSSEELAVAKAAGLSAADFAKAKAERATN